MKLSRGFSFLKKLDNTIYVWGFVLLLLLFWQVKTVQPKLALSCGSSASASPPLGLQMFAVVPA